MRSPMGVPGLREHPGEPLGGSLGALCEFLTGPGRCWVPMDPVVGVLGSFCGVPGRVLGGELGRLWAVLKS